MKILKIRTSLLAGRGDNLKVGNKARNRIVCRVRVAAHRYKNKNFNIPITIPLLHVSRASAPHQESQHFSPADTECQSANSARKLWGSSSLAKCAFHAAYIALFC